MGHEPPARVGRLVLQAFEEEASGVSNVASPVVRKRLEVVELIVDELEAIAGRHRRSAHERRLRGPSRSPVRKLHAEESGDLRGGELHAQGVEGDREARQARNPGLPGQRGGPADVVPIGQELRARRTGDQENVVHRFCSRACGAILTDRRPDRAFIRLHGARPRLHGRSGDAQPRLRVDDAIAPRRGDAREHPACLALERRQPFVARPYDVTSENADLAVAAVPIATSVVERDVV